MDLQTKMLIVYVAVVAFLLAYFLFRVHTTPKTFGCDFVSPEFLYTPVDVLGLELCGHKRGNMMQPCERCCGLYLGHEKSLLCERCAQKKLDYDNLS